MTGRGGGGDGASSGGSPNRYSRRQMLRLGALGAGAVGAGALLTGPVLEGSAGAATSGVARRLGAAATAPRLAPKRGGTLNFGRDTGPTQLDPANSIVAGDVYTLDKIFEPLYITSPSGVLTPWLAEGHTMSSDGKTWTFVLRPGVKFSDGKPVTPADVVFSIHRAATDSAGPLSFLDFAIKSITAERLEHCHLRALTAVGTLLVGHLGLRQLDPAEGLRGRERGGVLRQPDRHRARSC